jgi:tetratricopeptide (TPR) repeat protein
VIGKDFAFDVLRAIVGLPEETVRGSLQSLHAGEFVVETNSTPHLECAFKHALTHEVAYESLAVEERRLLHAKTVEAIEALYPDRLTDHVERLAHHAFRGEVWRPAVSYLRQAGKKAAARSANREAVASFEQALHALQRLPSERDSIEQAIDVRFELRNPLHLLAQFARIFDHLHEAQALAEAIDDQSRLGWVSSYLAQSFRLTGNHEQAIQCGDRAVAIAESQGDFALRVATELQLGSAHEDLGDYRRASAILRGVVERLQGDLRYERFRLSGVVSLVARAHLVCSLAELGEFGEGFDRGIEAIQLAEEVYDPHGLVNAYFGVATLSILKQEFRQSIAVLERGLELCQSSTLSLMLPRVSASLGFVYAVSGRVGEAIPLLEGAVERATSMKLMNMYSMFLTWLAETYLIAGRRADALELGERALQHSRQQHERGHEAYALRLLGELAAHQEPADLATAERYYRQALALAEALGMRPLVGRCHLALGRVCRHAGKGASAEQHLTAAVGLFRELDMRTALDEAEEERKALL